MDGINYYVTDAFGQGLYESCKDVKFGTMNTKAMEFIGAGAHNFKGTLIIEKFLWNTIPFSMLASIIACWSGEATETYIYKIYIPEIMYLILSLNLGKRSFL